MLGMERLSVYIYLLGLGENIPTTWYFKILNQQAVFLDVQLNLDFSFTKYSSNQ